MKTVQLSAPGFEAIETVDLPDPVPGNGEVVLRMTAASVNFRDLIVAGGKYSVQFPLVPLSDGVGVVEEIGEGVTELKRGDRVSPIFAPRWLSGPPTDAAKKPALGGEIDGVLREKMAVDATAVVRVPDHLSDAEAATLPVAGVTAWSAVVDFGQVKPGDTVLIEGTGGVALFALQFAKLAGARVAILSSSDEKLERAKALGADLLFNYRDNPEWGPAVLEATGGVDLVVETVGADTLAQAVSTLATGARVAQIGLMSGVDARLPLQFFIPRGVTMQGILVGGRDRFEAMNKAIGLHGLKPVISESFGFDELPGALGRLAKGGHFGKIVIDIA
jgi:NADPH:quinone reductase-like Zn-dependent oxidoreductase